MSIVNLLFKMNQNSAAGIIAVFLFHSRFPNFHPTWRTKHSIRLTQGSHRYKHDLENADSHTHLHAMCVKSEHHRDILWSFHIKTNMQTRTAANGLKQNHFISRSTNLEIIPRLRNQVQIRSVCYRLLPIGHTHICLCVCLCVCVCVFLRTRAKRKYRFV